MRPRSLSSSRCGTPCADGSTAPLDVRGRPSRSASGDRRSPASSSPGPCRSPRSSSSGRSSSSSRAGSSSGASCPDLPAPGAVGAAIVTSVYLSAHLVNVVARVGRVRPAGRSSSAPSCSRSRVAVRADPPSAGWRRSPARPAPASTAALRDDARPGSRRRGRPGRLRRPVRPTAGTRRADGWVTGGWNWSDLLVHVAIGSSIAAGNFPPEVPYFAGEPLTYHWFADFHGAIASSVAGVDLIAVYFVDERALRRRPGARGLGAGAAADRRARRVATIATILVCFGGGMGWIRLVGDLIAGGRATRSTLVSTTSYDNTWADGWPFFQIASVFGTGFLPHRATTLGLPGLVAVVLLVVDVPRPAAGRRPARRDPGRAPRAVPVLRVPGDLPDRRPVRR